MAGMYEYVLVQLVAGCRRVQFGFEAEAPVRGASVATVKAVFAEEVFRQLDLVKSEEVQDKRLIHSVQQKFEVFQNFEGVEATHALPCWR